MTFPCGSCLWLNPNTVIGGGRVGAALAVSKAWRLAAAVLENTAQELPSLAAAMAALQGAASNSRVRAKGYPIPSSANTRSAYRR
jgi:hypothetical protein